MPYSARCGGAAYPEFALDKASHRPEYIGSVNYKRSLRLPEFRAAWSPIIIDFNGNYHGAWTERRGGCDLESTVENRMKVPSRASRAAAEPAFGIDLTRGDPPGGPPVPVPKDESLAERLLQCPTASAERKSISIRVRCKKKRNQRIRMRRPPCQ